MTVIHSYYSINFTVFLQTPYLLAILNFSLKNLQGLDIEIKKNRPRVPIRCVRGTCITWCVSMADAQEGFFSSVDWLVELGSEGFFDDPTTY